MEHEWLKTQLDRDIVSLLAANRLLPLEKRLWLSVLPEMTEDEKTQLKKNLEEEVKYEIKTTEEAGKKFVAALEKEI